MPKVSPGLQCVMGWSMQYPASCTVLAIDRTGNQVTNNAHLGVQNILETACTTVTYAAMLSALFLAALMLAIQLTQGDPEKHEMPQPWARAARSCCVYAVGMQYVIIHTVWRLSGYTSRLPNHTHPGVRKILETA